MSGPAAAAEQRAPAAPPQVIPMPASLTAVPGGSFELTRDTRISVTSRAALGVATALAERLRRATGFPLPVRVGGGIGITLGLSDASRAGGEDYTLTVSRHEVRLRAGTAEGLFRATQTLRQLLPAKAESPTARPGPWVVPGVRIADRPRFGWRGAMLDVSRHFFSVAEVKRYIDLAALYKVNRLHLHLADDQGWRIMIDSWPRLATIGGSTEVGGGPGGFYTKADYTEIVRYAAARYITVVPEIDMPGHTNAALASYAELNCDGVAPPLYTGTDVGFSSLCVSKEITYRFIDDVVREIAALTPGPYMHIGGDEAHSTPDEDYVTFIERVRDIVARHGKTMAGWKEIAGASIAPGSVAQFWGTTNPGPTDIEQAKSAVAQGATVLMSPCDKAYLDMKYTPSTPFGLTWCAVVEAQDSYSWDPAQIVDGVTDDVISGVEAPLWSETIDDIGDAEFMAYPRLAGIAEIGWSPAAGRTWEDYRSRLAAQGPRWDVLGVNFYRSPQVPWATE
ncbi:MAG TPA: beta-N-acetylhexosaminidase [Streptosporangiaceae bacterium]|jgi:hexosaminidase|nr:beta-N-acetylhexosaminidase [Streptosporangiaceae bacterium]